MYRGTQMRKWVGIFAMAWAHVPFSVMADGSGPKVPLGYLVASENEDIASAITALLGTYNLIAAAEGDVSQVIFLQRDDAISGGRIAPEVLEGIEGGVKQSLLSADSGSDACYIDRFDIVDGWALTMIISATPNSFDHSMQCFSVGLHYHLRGQPPVGEAAEWKTTLRALFLGE